MPELSPVFLEFLKTSKKGAKYFAEIIKEYNVQATNIPAAVAHDAGDRPKKWVEGQTHEMTTVGISDEDLNAITEEAADAAVVERFVAYIKGFVSGVMFAA